jgi:hypothetical protein
MARISRYWNLHSGARLAARHRTLEALARRHRELRETPPPPEPPVPEMDWRRPCHGCGAPTSTVYCDACCDKGIACCPHGLDAASCDACDVESDLAYDAWRESR